MARPPYSKATGQIFVTLHLELRVITLVLSSASPLVASLTIASLRAPTTYSAIVTKVILTRSAITRISSANERARFFM